MRLHDNVPVAEFFGKFHMKGSLQAALRDDVS